jgi:hypothetical protein
VKTTTQQQQQHSLLLAVVVAVAVAVAVVCLPTIVVTSVELVFGKQCVIYWVAPRVALNYTLENQSINQSSLLRRNLYGTVLYKNRVAETIRANKYPAMQTIYFYAVYCTKVRIGHVCL